MDMFSIFKQQKMGLCQKKRVDLSYSSFHEKHDDERIL